jgi:hypothetical protein
MPLEYFSPERKTKTNRKCQVPGDVHSGGLPEDFLHFDEAMGQQAHIRGAIFIQGLPEIKWLMAVLLVPSVKLLSFLVHHAAGAIVLFLG